MRATNRTMLANFKPPKTTLTTNVAGANGVSWLVQQERIAVAATSPDTITTYLDSSIGMGAAVPTSRHALNTPLVSLVCECFVTLLTSCGK